MAYFRWILAYIDVLCQLFTFNIQKNDFWVQKWKNFEICHCGSFLGYLTRKKIILSQQIVKITAEKNQNQENPDRPLLGAHFIIQIAVGGSQFIPNVHKNDGYGPKIVFFGHCRPFGLNDLIITQNCKTASVGMAQ